MFLYMEAMIVLAGARFAPSCTRVCWRLAVEAAVESQHQLG